MKLLPSSQRFRLTGGETTEMPDDSLPQFRELLKGVETFFGELIEMHKEMATKTARELADMHKETERAQAKEIAIVLAQIQEDLANVSKRLDDVERRLSRARGPVPRSRRGSPRG
jgi:hypothetical protein